MNIQTLICFVTLAETLNFTKAAQKCYISQPAFSKQISALEEQLGVSLFIRNNKSVTLTATGRSCLEYAQNIVWQYEHLLACARDASKPSGEVLRISCLDIQGMRMLVEAQSKFIRIGNSVNISVIKQTQIQQVEDILRDDGSVDAILAVDFGLERHPQLAWKTIYTDYACVVLPKKHPLACKTEVSIYDLRNERFIQHEQETSKYFIDTITRIASQYGFKPKYAGFKGSVEDIIMSVALNEGVSFFFHTAITVHSEQICVRRLKEDITIPVVLVWNKNRFCPAILDIADTLISLYRE